MLRILVFFKLLNGLAYADNLQKAQNKADKAISAAKSYQLSSEFKELLKEERKRLSLIESQSKPQMTLSPDVSQLDAAYQKILALTKNFGREAAPPPVTFAPIILVSFSMPDIEIKKLIFEAKRLDAAIAIRGLYRNSFKETYKKIASLFENSDEVGILIDPTLFRRFAVKSVPTFILPLEPISRCKIDGCPLEKHVKATGSVSLDYFLDHVGRVGTVQQAKVASFWLKKLRGQKA